MGIEQEKKVRAAFRTIPGVGSQRLRQLITYFGSAVQAWEASSRLYLQAADQEKWLRDIVTYRERIDPLNIDNALTKQGILTVTPEEGNYPFLLGELSDAPPLLYYQGQLQGNVEALAIVGSRQATTYGKSAARMLARDAVLKGIAVASGLARGIDTAAHKGALESGGITWAFLGCGLDQIYPSENRCLAENILERGALISEYPPGAPPHAAHFPARNRLISGCARGVVVIEAAEKSGALITVDFALEQGREVFAVPGPIFSPMSRGTHQLLRQGAKIVEGIEDIWNEIPSWQEQTGVSSFRLGASTSHFAQRMEPCERTEHAKIIQVLSDVPIHLDQLSIQATISSARLSLALLELQLEGKIVQLPGQHYVLAREC